LGRKFRLDRPGRSSEANAEAKKVNYKVTIDEQAKNGIVLRGANRQLMSCRSQEVILAGPAETGKTWVGCIKLHLTCMKYPGSQHAMVRKTNVSIAGTVGRTFRKIVADAGVHAYGGESPSKYIYPNGSVVWVGGMDNPDSILSAERDSIYVCQAEELTDKDWETLTTRCTGRGSTIKWPQLFGDCNPGGSKHWIRERAAAGKLTLLNTTHIDNPTLYLECATLEEAKAKSVTQAQMKGMEFTQQDIDSVSEHQLKQANGKFYTLTEQGCKSIKSLSNLTGVRQKRLFKGIWATSEGAVYPMFDAAIHVQHRKPEEMVKWYLAMDEGFTNPQTNLLIGEDNDGRWHVFEEYYVTQHLESEIVAQAKGWYQDVRTSKAVGKFVGRPVVCSLAACDAAAAGLIASLNAAGLDARAGKGLIGGNGKVKGGIDKIQDRLKVQADGRPRLTLEPGYCNQTVNEFESYVWKPEKDVPVDAFNHAIGGLRYLEDALAEPTGAWDANSVASAAQAAKLAPHSSEAEDDGSGGIGFEELAVDL
jgi:hypothetical protein